MQRKCETHTCQIRLGCSRVVFAKAHTWARSPMDRTMVSEAVGTGSIPVGPTCETRNAGSSLQRDIGESFFPALTLG